MPTKKTTATGPCKLCRGEGCAKCLFSGKESTRRSVDDGSEHPAVTQLDLAAHAWAAEQKTPAAKAFIHAMLVFAHAVSRALTGNRGEA